MNPERFSRLREIVLTAARMPRDARPAYLEQACGADAELRREAGELLEHAGRTPRIARTDAFEHLVAEMRTGPEGPEPEPLPERVGPYRVLGMLGEGGMGVVFRAEQREPFHREVAVKLVRSGAGSVDAVARFESERRVLALVDHPNIARLLDAGSHAGRPYFVMELIRGVPITRYCRERALSVRERVVLFLDVARAVRHAHRRGIIHRDLKPSNILVTEIQGRPVPKIIDFSIAKALEEPLLGTAFRTRTGQIVGTLEYMSPEQARGETAAVDTRSDVYALGILLHELLAERLPYDVSGRPFHEAVRIITEQPARSLRRTVSTAGGRIDADLDTIAGKCLEKDPERRYNSAAELAEDLERYLDRRPLLARRPSAAYLMRTFVRRHRLAVASVAAVIVAVVVGVAGLAGGLVRAVRSEREARAAEAKARSQATTATEVTEFLTGLFEASSPSRARGGTVTARALLDRGAERIRGAFDDRPQVRARLMTTMGKAYQDLGLFEEAEGLLVAAVSDARGIDPDGSEGTLVPALNALGWLRFRQLRTDEAESLYAEAVSLADDRAADAPSDFAAALMGLGMVRRDQGRFAEAKDALERALAIREQAFGPGHAEVAYTQLNLGWLHNVVGEYADARTLLERALPVIEREEGDGPGLAQGLKMLAIVLGNLGDHEGARPYLERALDIEERMLGPDHVDLAATLDALGVLLWRLEDYDAATTAHERALAIREKVLGKSHEQVAWSLNNLALVRRATGDADGARRLYERALGIYEKAGKGEGPQVARTLGNLAQVASATGDRAAARRYLERALAIQEATLGPDHPDVAATLNTLGSVTMTEGLYDEARAFLERALDIRERKLPADHPSLSHTHANLARMLAMSGRVDEAIRHYERAIAIRESPLVLSDLGDLLTTAGRHDEARRVLERAVELAESTLPPDHPDLGQGLGRLGRLLSETGDPDGALPLLERALAIHEAALRPDDPRVAASLARLGRFYLDTGSPGQALPFLERAVSILAAKYPPGHPDVRSAREAYALAVSAGRTRTAAR